MTTPHDSYFADNLELVFDAFKDIEWETILDNSSCYDYSSMSHALHMAATKEDEDGRQPHGRVLRLMSEACSMRLSIEKLNDPFPHPPSNDGWRPTIPTDFTVSEIDFVAKVFESINYPLLKGRLADLLWHCRKPREVKFAKFAIDSYSQLPLDADTWFAAGDRCWQRAINLCRMIRDSAGDRLNRIESSIIKALMSAKTDRGFHGHMLAETLMCNGLAKNQSTEIATRLESMASEFENVGNFHAAAGYRNAAAKWFNLSGDVEKAIDMTVAEAEAHEKKAAAGIASDNPSHIVAAECLERAVLVYRRIPGDHRNRYQVEQRIQELSLRISEYGQKAMDEMATYTTPGVDVSDLADEARKLVGGKPVSEALMFFVTLHRVDVKELRESAKEDLSRFVSQRVFGNVFLSHDGRVVDRTAAYSESAPSEENEDTIRANMNQFHYGFGVQIAVIAQILPALDVLNSEHPLSEADFIDFARRSPIVPENREVLWGKALAQGFHQDFVTSIHLLTPQIENMVRFRLNSVGVSTTHRDQNGIRTEKGLSALIDLPEAKVVLGENLTYEIKAQFCDQIGPNLRNNIAHGLLDDQQCYSCGVVYAWWLGLKLVLNSLWESLSQNPEEQGGNQDD